MLNFLWPSLSHCFRRFVFTAIFVTCGLAPCAASFAASSSPARLPAYVVTLPSEVRDSYILTQLFYASINAEDIELVQQVVRQGLLAAPRDFPRVMAVALELLKKPDSRLFMLLSPISEHIANPDQPADISAMVHLAGMLSGHVLPGGIIPDLSPGPAEERGREPLRHRIRFYPEGDTTQNPIPDENAEVPVSVQATEPNAESLIYERLAQDGEDAAGAISTLDWLRSPASGARIASTASDSRLEDGSVWGGVRSISYGDPVPHKRDVFFVARNGIINFVQPRGVTEVDFYADEQARAHHMAELEEEIYNVRPDSAILQPCRMEIQSAPKNRSWPPELDLYLQQTNPGSDYSAFLCMPQCILTYTWNGAEYVVSGKRCSGENEWGVWPYSQDRYYEVTGENAEITGENASADSGG